MDKGRSLKINPAISPAQRPSAPRCRPHPPPGSPCAKAASGAQLAAGGAPASRRPTPGAPPPGWPEQQHQPLQAMAAARPCGRSEQDTPQVERRNQAVRKRPPGGLQTWLAARNSRCISKRWCVVCTPHQRMEHRGHPAVEQVMRAKRRGWAWPVENNAATVGRRAGWGLGFFCRGISSGWCDRPLAAGTSGRRRLEPIPQRAEAADAGTSEECESPQARIPDPAVSSSAAMRICSRRAGIGRNQAVRSIRSDGLARRALLGLDSETVGPVFKPLGPCIEACCRRRAPHGRLSSSGRPGSNRDTPAHLVGPASRARLNEGGRTRPQRADAGPAPDPNPKALQLVHYPAPSTAPSLGGIVIQPAAPAELAQAAQAREENGSGK